MSQQTVQFKAESSLSLSVRLFLKGSDTIISEVDAVESAIRFGTYTVVFEDNANGVCEIIATISGAAVAALYEVRLVDADGVYYAYDTPDSVIDSIERNVVLSNTAINSVVVPLLGEIETDIGTIDTGGGGIGPESGFHHTDVVINSATSNPEEGLLIEVVLARTLSPVITSTRTNVEGEYTVFASSEGPFDIRISGSGFETTTVQNVTFTEN